MKRPPSSLLAVLRGRWRTVGAGLLAGLGIAAAYAALAPDWFVSTSTFLIDPGVGSGAAAELDLLRSERVAQRVVENEHLAAEASFRDTVLAATAASLAPSEVIARRLAASIDADSSGAGRIVHLAVRSPDAGLSARIANAYALAYGEVSLQLRAEGIRAGVERAQQELSDLRLRMDVARRRTSGAGSLTSSTADEQFTRLSRLASETGAMHPGTALEAPAAAGEEREGAEFPAMNARPVERSTAGAEAEILLAQQSLERTQERLARLSADSIGAPFPVQMLVPAQPAAESAKPTTPECLGLGTLAGLLLAGLALFLVERIDRRVRRHADLSREVGVAFLGDVPAAAHAAQA